MTKLLLALGLIVLGWWILKRPAPKSRTRMDEVEAQSLLGVGPLADVETIREAHRRLIQKVHPDTGGSPELARRVNEARDILVASSKRNASKTRP